MRLYLLIAFLLYYAAGSAQIEDRLEIFYKMKNEDNIMGEDYSVYLYEHMILVDSVVHNWKGGFTLDLYSDYKVVFQGEGYYSKVVRLSTFMPEERIPYKFEPFGFTISLSKLKSEKDTAEGRFLGLIEFSEEMDDFDYTLGPEQNDEIKVGYCLNSGIYHQKNGDVTKAIDCFSQALEVDSLNGECFYHRGLCYYQVKDTIKSCEDLHKAADMGLLKAERMSKALCK